MPSAAHLVAGVAKTTLAAALMVAAGQNSGEADVAAYLALIPTISHPTSR